MVAVLSTKGMNTKELPNLCCVGQSGSGLEPDTTVALFTDNIRDAERVARLLCRSSAEPLRVCLCDSQTPPLEHAFAAVVCHRKSVQPYGMSLPQRPQASRVIVLSDCDNESTTVRFLEGGARHVFNLNESDQILQVRLEAALRRHRSLLMRSFTVADIHFDVQKRKVIRDGVRIDLSPKEFDFACYVFSRPDKIVVNAELMTSVWSLPPHMDTRRIDTAACRVRKKLGLSSKDDWELRRIRCVGYRLIRVNSNVVELAS